MARRRLTVKRIDPWSVLKFGAVVNLALLAIGLLVLAVAWFIIERLGLVDQACDIAFEVGFTACGINAGNLFRALVLLGLLGVVVQTAVLVFLSFLHNLIADLTGGLTLSVIDDTPAPVRVSGPPAATTPTGGGRDGGPRRGDERRGSPPVPPLGREGRDRGAADATAPHRPVGTDEPRAGGDAARAGHDAAERRAERRNEDPRRPGSDDDLFSGR
ncbi:hypothetical protein FTX61_07410 [Nitriliruptoraceae bacterium ZYF776]|nr:hypothetical protein [Profundirhabdus halotolerans]